MKSQIALKMSLFGSLMAAGAALASPAKADNWACEVALCISNPAGPMAVSECVPPIQKLYRHLARGHSFPLCKSADGYVNFTRYGKEYYDNCPAGTKTVYRTDNDRGIRRQKLCETFTPIKGGYYPIGGDRDGYNDGYEIRIVDGKRIYGKVERKLPPRREKPSYLEYVVQGKTSRIWW